MPENNPKKNSKKKAHLSLNLETGKQTDFRQVYLSILSRFLPQMVFPNFYCSMEYFDKSGWRAEVEGNDITIVDSEGVIMLPTIYLKEDRYNINPDSKYMAGFTGLDLPIVSREKHDDEFIYNPRDFTDLSGGKWKMVRKNIRWAEKDIGSPLMALLGHSTIAPEAIERFLERWGEVHPDVYEPETILKYVLFGENRLFIVDEKHRELFGILAFDFNFNYANFRYCLVREGIRGLSDWARVFFYRIIHDHYPNRPVNDGGSLDSESLYHYKARLNPERINTIWSTL